MGIPVPLLSGAYNSPAYIAAAQRCVNLYPEQNPNNIQSQQTAFTPIIPFTHRLTPGLKRKFTFPEGTTVRMLNRASNGDLYGVCGTSVYFIDGSFSLFMLGTISAGTTPVKMKDNGTTAVLVDGSSTGYQINLASHVMSGITSASASGTNGFFFPGATYIDEVDGFMVGNQPGTGNWFSSENYNIAFDSLAVARKSGAPDPIAFLAVLHRYVWLVGETASEIWFDAGSVNFPFQLVAGPYIEHGAAAPYSGAVLDESVFWLSKDLRGNGIVLEGKAFSFTTDRVSTHAIEQEIATYFTIEDAQGFAYQEGGHSFYVLRFPTADKTWCYDRVTGQWHERISFDSDMGEHQWRVNCVANAYGVVLGGDYNNGKVYLIDPTSSTDDGAPIQRRRGFPHIANQLKRVRHQQFMLDIESGNVDFQAPQPIMLATDPQVKGDPFVFLVTDGSRRIHILLDPVTQLYDFGAPQVYLRWSNTRGKSWGNPVPRSLGFGGEYNKSVQWRQLGLGRDRVYEVFWTSPQVTALNGAYVEPDSGRT